MNKSYINIHHSAIFAKNDTDVQFVVVDASHKARWGGKTLSKLGFYGGYHYFIERNGTVRQFRGDDETGAHNDAALMNYRALGICLAGDISQQQLTGMQILAIVTLIRKLQKMYGILDANIKPHRFYKSTQCPGNNIPDKTWEYLQDQFNKLNSVDEPIVKWHKDNNIITKWNSPPTADEIKLGWTIYKALKQNTLGKLEFNF